MNDVLWTGRIPLAPVTKKNHQEIWIDRRTGKPFVAQSKQYRQYETDAMWYLQAPKSPISDMVNVKAIFYMPTRRRVDLINLLQSVLDILVRSGVLLDDNSRIVYTIDGSRVDYDKDNPRTEIEITKIEL